MTCKVTKNKTHAGAAKNAETQEKNKLQGETMYRNATEIIVEQKLESIWRSYDGCKCKRCHDDIIAYALNRLPVHYISTSKGELYNKAASLSLDFDVEVTKILVMAMQLVSQNPRHPLKKSENGYDVFKEMEEDDFDE